MDVVIAALASLAINVPLYLVWLAGIVVAIVRRRQHPRVSQLVITGLAMLLLVSIFASMFNVLIPRLVMRNGWNANQTGVMIALVSGAARLVETAAWVLILIAVFGGRSRTAVYGSRE